MKCKQAEKSQVHNYSFFLFSIIPLSKNKNSTIESYGCFIGLNPPNLVSLSRIEIMQRFSDKGYNIQLGRGVVTLLQLPAPIAQNLILLYIMSSKPFSDWKSVEISRTAPRFSKNFPHSIFFEKFQNYRRELPKSSFDQKFYTEKRYNGTFFDKSNMLWGDIASFSHF